MMRPRSAVLATTVLLVAAGPVLAEEWDGPGARGHHGTMLSALVRGAGLNDAQKAQVRQIVEAHRPQFRNLVSQLRSARQALDARLFGPAAVTSADLAPMLAQINQLRGQLMQESLQVALEIRAILSPEQLAKAAQFRERLSELQQEMRSLLSGAH